VTRTRKPANSPSLCLSVFLAIDTVGPWSPGSFCYSAVLTPGLCAKAVEMTRRTPRPATAGGPKTSYAAGAAR
jgi:hypothetical protein